MLDKLKGYRTLAFNGIMAALLLWRTLRPADPVPGEAEVTTILDMFFNSLDLITLVGNVFLRFKTTTPVGKSA